MEWSLNNAVMERTKTLNTQKRNKSALGLFANGVFDFVSDIDFIAKVNTPGTDTTVSDEVRAMVNARPVSNSGKFKKVVVSNPVVLKLRERAINDLIASFMYLMSDMERRRIGTALSSSKPGRGMDILLQI
jgi:hypothetical protein